MKYAPGPWSVNVIGQHWNNKSLKHIEVTFGQGGECICDTVYNPSDANLLAAAPDLLEALQELVLLYEHDEGCRKLTEYKRAKAAISKALGKSDMRLEQAFIINIDIEYKENGTMQLSQTSDKPGRENENDTVLIDKKGAEGLIKHLQRFISGE